MHDMAQCTSRKAISVPQIDSPFSPHTHQPQPSLQGSEEKQMVTSFRRNVALESEKDIEGAYIAQSCTLKISLYRGRLSSSVDLPRCVHSILSLFPSPRPSPSLPLFHLLLLPFLSHFRSTSCCYNVVEIMDLWMSKCRIIVLMSYGNKQKSLLLYSQIHKIDCAAFSHYTKAQPLA